MGGSRVAAAVHPPWVANLSVQHLDAKKTDFNAMFQIASGGGLTEPGFADHFIYGKAVLNLIVKQLLYPCQRVFFNSFATVVLTIVFRLQLIE